MDLQFSIRLGAWSSTNRHWYARWKSANLISLHCTRSFMCDIMISHVYDLVLFKHVFIFFVLAIKTHAIMKEWSINRRRLVRVSRLNSLMVERREIGDVCSKRTNSFLFFFATKTCTIMKNNWRCNYEYFWYASIRRFCGWGCCWRNISDDSIGSNNSDQVRKNAKDSLILMVA